MIIEYKTFAIFKVSCLILLSSLDLTEVAKERLPSKCCSLIYSHIIIRLSPLEMKAFVPLNGSTEREMTKTDGYTARTILSCLRFTASR